MDKVCSFESCNRDVKAKGYCAGHYQQLKGGKELKPLRAFARRGSYRSYSCSFSACVREAAVGGLCDGHYQQRRRGKELSPLKPVVHGCSVDGCEERHEARGFCRKHYDRWRAHGTTDKVLRSRRDPSPIQESPGHLCVVLLGKYGGVCLVDLGDRALVEGKRWWASPAGYVKCKIEGRQVLLSRLILGLEPGDPRQADHVDGDPLNNRRENLRIVTYEQNMQNKKPWGKSGHRNVYYDEKKELYRVIVTHRGKRHSGGRHKKLEDAIVAAQKLRDKLFSHHNEDRT